MNEDRLADIEDEMWWESVPIEIVALKRENAEWLIREIKMIRTHLRDARHHENMFSGKADRYQVENLKLKSELEQSRLALAEEQDSKVIVACISCKSIGAKLEQSRARVAELETEDKLGKHPSCPSDCTHDWEPHWEHNQ